MRTVARMYTLSSWSSKPRDENKENHAGLMMDPLEIAVSNRLPNS